MARDISVDTDLGTASLRRALEQHGSFTARTRFVMPSEPQGHDAVGRITNTPLLTIEDEWFNSSFRLVSAPQARFELQWIDSPPFRPSMYPQSIPSDDGRELLVAASVAGGLSALLAVAMAAYCCYCRRTPAPQVLPPQGTQRSTLGTQRSTLQRTERGSKRALANNVRAGSCSQAARILPPSAEAVAAAERAAFLSHLEFIQRTEARKHMQAQSRDAVAAGKRSIVGESEAPAQPLSGLQVPKRIDLSVVPPACASSSTGDRSLVSKDRESGIKHRNQDQHMVPPHRVEVALVAHRTSDAVLPAGPSPTSCPKPASSARPIRDAPTLSEHAATPQLRNMFRQHLQQRNQALSGQAPLEKLNDIFRRQMQLQKAVMLIKEQTDQSL